MKKIYNPRELHDTNLELFDKIEEAVKIYLPRISDHIVHSLRDAPRFSVAEHSTFVRLVDTDTDEKYFCEIRTLNMKTGTRETVTSIYKIILYDTFEEYEHERKKLSNEYESTQYKGEPL